MVSCAQILYKIWSWSYNYRLWTIILFVSLNLHFMLLPRFCPYRPSIQGIQAVNLEGIFYHQERPIFQLSTISGGILSSPPSLRGYKITLLRNQSVYFPNLFVIFHAPSAHFSRDWFHMDKNILKQTFSSFSWTKLTPFPSYRCLTSDLQFHCGLGILPTNSQSVTYCLSSHMVGSVMDALLWIWAPLLSCFQFILGPLERSLH